MRILIAPDSFKGALDQIAVSQALARGLQRTMGADGLLDLCPMADGGEGTGSLFILNGGEKQFTQSVDAFGRRSDAHWLLYKDVAIVEASVGSPYCSPEMRPASAWDTTSRGTGILIQNALDDPRVRQVWVALGGTGSTDGGLGLLSALGAAFYDERGHELPARTKYLRSIAKGELPPLDKPVVALADVLVPLTGPNGAVWRFGAQKGLTVTEQRDAEESLGQLAEVLAPDTPDRAGAGAAGGMGFALMALGASMVSGSGHIAQAMNLAARIAQADWVITGEGRLDDQSLMGKVISVVLDEASRLGKPTIVVCGEEPDDLTRFYQRGMAFSQTLVHGPMRREDAIAQTPTLLEHCGETIGRILRIVNMDPAHSILPKLRHPADRSPS